MARGMLIQEDRDAFVILGVGFSVRFRHPRPSGAPRAVRHAEWGRYQAERWIALHPIRRERPEAQGDPICMPQPGVARVFLEPAPTSQP